MVFRCAFCTFLFFVRERLFSVLGEGHVVSRPLFNHSLCGFQTLRYKFARVAISCSWDITLRSPQISYTTHWYGVHALCDGTTQIYYRERSGHHGVPYTLNNFHPLRVCIYNQCPSFLSTFKIQNVQFFLLPLHFIHNSDSPFYFPKFSREFRLSLPPSPPVLFRK